MRINTTITFITLVISFIIILALIDNYSKSESSTSSLFSSTPIPFVSKFAFAAEDNKTNSNANNITNANLVNVLVEKVRTLVKIGNYHEALKLIDKVLAIDGNDTDAMDNKGIALGNLGKYQEAILWFDKALSLDGNDTYAMDNKGIALGNLGKDQEAILWFDKALSLDGNDTSAMDNKGIALDSLRKYQEAITWYDKLLAIDGNDTDVMGNKANALDNLGKYQEAITLYDKLLAIDGNDTRTMNNKGITLDSLGKHREAITWFDKALNQTQSTGIDIDTVSNKAFVLGIELKEYDNALSLTEEYLKKSPEHKGLLCTTVEIYNETGYEGIASHYKEQLTKLDPNYECGLITKVSEIEKEAFA